MATLQRHHTQDIDDQAAALAGWQQHYEQLGAGRFAGSVWQALMDDGLLLREHTNRALREQVRPPPGQRVFAVPLAVQPGSRFAGAPLTRDVLLLITPGDDADLVAAGELELVGLSVRESLLQQLLSEPESHALAGLRTGARPVAPCAAEALRALLLRAADEVSEGDDRPDAERRFLAETAAHATGLVLDGALERPAVAADGGRRRRIVERALEFMREQLHADIGVPEMCAAACASRRTLQYAFQSLLQTTPQACLRALRLNEARRRLKSADPPPVTALALLLGFASASHFTRHYKAQFDELPSQTIRVGRRAVLADP